MKKIELNIAKDVIKTNIAAQHNAAKLSNNIEKTLASITEPTLIIVNMLGVEWLDYKFIVLGLSKLIQAHRTDENIYLIIKANKYEKEEIFLGISFLLSNNNDESIAETNIIENGYWLIIVDHENSYNYLSSLTEKQIEVLNSLEECETMSSSEIQEKFSLIPEETAKTIEDLLKCKFIFKINGPLYKSIKSLS